MLTLPRCVLTLPRCMLTLPRCVLTLPRCVLTQVCVNPTQVYVDPTQVYVNPTQVCVNLTQVCVNPTQVCVNPTPVCVNPTQVCVNPTPVYVTPTQVLRTAVRRPELHPDDAHFAGGFTVAVLSLELELQALLEASPSPPSKCSAPAHTPCWGLGAARVVQPHAPPSHHGHSAAAPSPHERLSTRSATLSLCAQRSVRIQAKFRAFFVTRLDRGTTKHTSQPEPLP
jgi:hypothetical protein